MARTPLALAALATSAIPGLEVVGVRGSQRATGDVQTAEIVDATGRHWVVRCPVSAAAGAAMEAERALLQNLAAAVDEERLPFAVPRPAGDVELPGGGRAVVVPALAGRPLDLEQLGPGPGLSAGLGRAVAALHELPPEVVADAGLPVYDADSYRARCLAEVDEVARTGHVPAVLLERWEQALENVALWRFRTTPVHGDLHPESILVSGTEVTAMTTFTSAHVGDPAEDLAWLMASAPLDALDAIEEAYTLARTASNDAALLDRAVLVSELAVARYLLHGVRAEEATVVADAAQMLRTLADQVADEPPIGQQEPVAAAAAGRADGPAHEVGAADGGPEEHESIEEAEPADSASERTGSVRLDPPPGTAEVESVGFAPAEGTDTPRNHAWDAQGTEELALPWELRESDERRASDDLSAEPGDEDPPRR